MTRPPDLLTAALATRYAFERELGRGGMATVYLARDVRHDRPVALKLLRPELATSIGSDRFLREISLTARLEHPGILPLLDSGNVEGLLYYVMPYVDGESLRDRLGRERQLPVADAVRIACEVADALGYAHARGIVHRDIKPGNILLSARHARIADFGIARAIVAAGGDTLTETGLAIGTLTYMSPEQATGTEDVDGRSDLYSLGCVLYEMLMGEPPFSASDPHVMFARKSIEAPRPIRIIRPAVPEDLERLIMKMLSPMAADRQSTSMEVVAALEQFEREAAGSSRSRPRMRLGAALAAGTLALAAVGTTVWDAWSERAPPPELSSSRVAIFPFRVDDADLVSLREGFMDLVSTRIDGAGNITRVDPFALMAHLGDEGRDEPPDLRTAVRVARRAGAGRFLLGRVLSGGDSIRVLVSLYTVADSSGPERQFEFTTSRDRTLALADSIANSIMMSVPQGAGTWVREHEGTPSTMYPAVHAYLKGEGLMRRSQQDSAGKAFRQAIDADPTFALGWLRLATAEFLQLNDSGMVTAIERALQYAERLAPRDRELARVLAANYRGNGEAAERAARSLTNGHPTYGEGWYQLADAQFSYAWQRGRSVLRAQAALERALQEDPDHRQALDLLGTLAEYEGRYAVAETLQRRAWNHLWSLPPAAPEEFEPWFARTATSRNSRLIHLAYSTAGRMDELGMAARIARVLTDPDEKTSDIRGFGHLILGLIEAAGGRWTAAESTLHEANAAEEGVGILERGWLAALPFLHVDSSRRRSLRDSLETWAIPASYTQLDRSRKFGEFPFKGIMLPPSWLVPHLRQYVLGLLCASLRDSVAARRHARQLREAREPIDTIGLLRDLSLDVDGLLALELGDPAAAVRSLSQAGMRVASRYQAFESMHHTRPMNRFLRAEALAASGQHREALAWYGTAPRVDAAFVLAGPSHLRQGEIHERLGDRAQAAYHYRRFLARWGNADPVHQPMLQNVRQRLARLEE